MKHWLPLSILVLPLLSAAQNDTLLFENFEIDPGPAMLPFPSGNDTVWVNFDEDGELVSPDLMGAPQDWYSEFGQFQPVIGDTNYVFTSISFLNNPNAYNHNWLVLPPIKLCDAKASIHWKSAPLEGPAFMDGYYLLISTTDNSPENFIDTLFGAAECTKLATFITTDPAKFEFSPGYIHANTFTDSLYFEAVAGQNRCKLEPHSYFLSDYAGKTVYLAFLHNSRDDNRLDLDDILVMGTKCTSPAAELGDFDIVEPVLYPNPVDWQMNVLFSLKRGGVCRFSVTDGVGRTVFEEAGKWFPGGRNEWRFWPKGLAAGNYFLNVETGNGVGRSPFY